MSRLRLATRGLLARLLATFLAALLAGLPGAALAQGQAADKSAGEDPAQPPAHPYVKLETNEGDILLELDGRRAPLTTTHFLALVDAGYYDGTIFHRVIPGFMIQGGGYTRDLKLKESEGSIPNESGNGLSNRRGTIAMARTEDPHSANAQFFINVAGNDRLDPQPERWGYAVFGYVVEGMEIADRIVSVPTGPAGDFDKDVPVAPIVIEKASRVTYGN